MPMFVTTFEFFSYLETRGHYNKGNISFVQLWGEKQTSRLAITS